MFFFSGEFLRAVAVFRYILVHLNDNTYTD